MLSVQSLSDADRRLAAAWAADCAEHVLPLFLAERPDDDRPARLIERARAYARGETDTATEISRRFEGGVGAREVRSPITGAAARSAGQAAATCHMGAHALGAAGYAASAVSLANPDRREMVEAEIEWQLAQLTPGVRAALRTLPMVGEDRSGPLGPGLLSTGEVGRAIRTLQERLSTGK
jgi:hypothetical protein